MNIDLTASILCEISTVLLNSFHFLGGRHQAISVVPKEAVPIPFLESPNVLNFFGRILRRISFPRFHQRHRSRQQSFRWNHTAPSCEVLEERLLLSGAPLLRDFTVMSQNLYLGTDLNPIIGALSTGNPDVFIPAVTAGWQQVVESNFEERAPTLADQILESEPTIIGLQEVALWKLGAPLDPAPADVVAFDFLDIFLDELAERGLEYTTVAVVDNFSAEIPGFTNPADPTSLWDIRLTDRDVILARSDLVAADLKISSSQADNFDTTLFFPLPPQLGGGIELTRGWTSVDVKIRGAEFRVINTHLENVFPGVGSAIQAAQAQEILAGPANTELPTILLGDFNSRADQNGDVYQLVTASGFSDVWTQTHPGEVGFTCCHDADLRNETVDFQEGRIDWILYRGDFHPLEMDLFNEELSDRTPSGLWVSDHAGLVASLVVHPLPVAHEFANTGASPAFKSNIEIGSNVPSWDSLVGSAAGRAKFSPVIADEVEEDDQALEMVFQRFPSDDLFSPEDETELFSLDSSLPLPV